MRPEDRVELRAVYFAIDEMRRKSANIIGLQRIFTPEDYRPATIMQIIRCLGHKLRQHLSYAAQFLCALCFTTLLVVCKANVVRLVRREHKILPALVSRQQIVEHSF